ncbi:MAG: signal peptidase II [Steroidobacteraceae bacterium]
MRVALVAALLIACVGCDQTTKSLAKEHLQGHPAASFLDGTLRLQYAENPGGFLSLGASLPRQWRTAVFTLGVAAIVAAVFLYAILAAASPLLQISALALICGGGIGNLIDRVRDAGNVTDFLNIGVGSIRTGIFNVADVALTIGFVLIVFEQGRAGPRRQ